MVTAFYALKSIARSLSFGKKYSQTGCSLSAVECGFCKRKMIRLASISHKGKYFCSDDCLSAYVSSPSMAETRGAWRNGVRPEIASVFAIVTAVIIVMVLKISCRSPMERDDLALSPGKNFTDSTGVINTAAADSEFDFTRGDTGRRWIALTFDAGRFTHGARETLEILAKHNVRATFFLTGEFIREHPDIAMQIAKGRHEVGNHTFSHPHFLIRRPRSGRYLAPTRENLGQELSGTFREYQKITGSEMRHLWRVPYGEFSSEILRQARDLGWRHVGWTRGKSWYANMDTMDWETDTGSAGYYTSEQIRNKILSFGNHTSPGANGAVILMHLGTGRRTDCVFNRLEEIISGLKNQGYQFVPVGEMLHLQVTGFPR